MRLQGKVALVTGSSRGIGEAIARGYAREGAKVIITYLEQADKAQQVAEEIGAVMCMKMDVRNSEEIKRVYKEVEEKVGKIDVLVANAGINITNDYEHLDEDAWDKVVETDGKGVWLTTKNAIPHLNDGAHVIMIGSLSGSIGGPRTPSYAFVKHGLEALCYCMARYVAPRNICVNLLHPGVIQSELTAQTMHPDIMKSTLANLLIKRLGTYEDMVPVAIFLADPANSWMTAQAVSVNGGQFAGGI